MLPYFIIIHAAEDRHVLLSLTKSDGYIEATVVNNSKYLFTTAEWRSDGLEGRPEQYKFRRTSSRSPIPKMYSTTLYKTNKYIIVPWNEPIHFYTMTYSGLILPSNYFRVFKNDDTGEKWHFKKPSLRNTISPVVATIPSASPVKIPPHIVRCFVESAIQKNEICPITLDALVMGNVAMTSCGHLFDRKALVSSIASSSGCPNCRAHVKEEDLVII